MLGRFEVYCDDILIFKCQFGCSSVGFLGHVIPDPGVAVDCRNESQGFCRAERATPTCCTDVRRFGGLAKYYRKFVQRLSSLAAQLTAL